MMYYFFYFLVAGVFSVIGYAFKSWRTNKEKEEKKINDNIIKEEQKRTELNKRREPIYDKIIELLIPVNKAIAFYCTALRDDAQIDLEKLFRKFTNYIESKDHELSFEIRTLIFSYIHQMNTIYPKLYRYQRKTDQRSKQYDYIMTEDDRMEDKKYLNIFSKITHDSLFSEIVDDIKEQVLEERH